MTVKAKLNYDMTVEAKLNSQGLHDVKCPLCQGTRIESFMMCASSEYDPNTKLCRVCGYAWRQIISPP